jgi:hypothetical protein
MFDSFKSAVHNRQVKAWEKKRRLGKRSFILYRGVLRWGGIMFVLTMFTNVYGRHMKMNWLPVVSSLIACPFAGYLWARCVWYLNEMHFRDAMKEQDSFKES